MPLTPQQKREAANLLNVLDLLHRRTLPALKPPFTMNAAELGQWWQRVHQIEEQLFKVRDVAAKVIAEPSELLGELAGDEILLFARDQYPFEHERAELEEAARIEAENAKRKAEENEVLRKAGVLKEETPPEPDAGESSGEAAPAEGEKDAEEAPTEDADAQPDPDAKEKGEWSYEISEEGTVPLRPMPTLEERKAAYAAGCARLQSLLKEAGDRLTQWAQTSPEKFKS